LMESMLMQVPVICSNVTSLPDTIGDSKFVFDPFDIEDIADKIYRVYTDEHFRELNSQNSVCNSKKFVTTNALQIFQKVYQELHTKS